MPDKLDHELASILEPLGVRPEHATPMAEEGQDPAHPLVVSLYDKEDEEIWKGLQKHQRLLMRRHPYATWITHEVQNEVWIHDREKEITNDIRAACLIILGVSVDFLLTIYEEGRSILAALQASSEQQQEHSIWIDHIQPVILRPVSDGDLDLGCCRPSAPTTHKSLAGAKPRDAACVESITLIETALKELIRRP